MPAIARYGDTVLTGHSCDATTTIKDHSNDVYAENIEVARQTDKTQTHDIGNPPICIPHTAIINVGSPNVFVNNLPVARVQDSADAGMIINGASAVFANNGNGGSPSSTLFEDSTPEPAVTITPAQQAAYSNNYATRAKYQTKDNIENGVDQHPEMPDDPNSPPVTPTPPTTPPVNCTGGGNGDLPGTMDRVLQEADRGEWKETGANANIQALYNDVGFPGFHDEREDTNAWCAAFVGSMLKKNCYKFNKSLSAGSYTNYGNPVAGGIDNAQRGDIVIFNRSGGSGHVTLYDGPGPRPGTIYVIGGNQSNNVTRSLRKVSDIKSNGGVQRPIPA